MKGIAMIEKLFPEKYFESIYEIDTNDLSKINVDTVIFDIDNTLVPYFIKVPDEKIIRYFKKLKKANIKIGILSNNKEKRVKLFCEKLDVIYEYKAGKPSIKSLKKIIKRLESKAENTIIIGDQIFTDIWCGNKLGIHTALVKQVSERDEWITKIKRGAEKIILKIYFKKITK